MAKPTGSACNLNCDYCFFLKKERLSPGSSFRMSPEVHASCADLEILDDTLIYLIIGDNGASAEGTLQGTSDERMSLGGFGHLETPEFLKQNIDKFGGPEAYHHYAVSRAHAMDTPYQWTKQVAWHWGGTRNGTIIHWPKGIKAKGEVRSQFHHVVDVAPTIPEAAGLPEPPSSMASSKGRTKVSA